MRKLDARIDLAPVSVLADWINLFKTPEELDQRIKNKGVHNRSSVSLSLSDTRLLGLGLKFVPTTSRLTLLKSYTNTFKKFERNLLIKLFFKNAPDSKFKAFLPSGSTWQPEWKPDTIKFRRMIANTVASLTPGDGVVHRSNLDPDLKISLHKWATHPSVLALLADKNLGVVLVDRTWYDGEVTKQMNTDAYVRLELQDINVKRIQLDLELICQRLCGGTSYKSRHKSAFASHFSKLKEFLLSRLQQFRIPYFYLICKIHKTNPDGSPKPMSGRPIVASVKWITTPMSSLVSKILVPLLKNERQHLLNSGQLTEKLSPLDLSGRCLLTADADSLYTSLQIHESLTLFEQFLYRHKDTLCREFNISHDAVAGEIESIYMMTAFVINNNYFATHLGLYYHQVKGIAMGTPLAPTFACAVLCQAEFKYKNLLKSMLYFRYIDDAFAAPLEEDKAVFSTILADLVPGLTWQTSDAYPAEFLDLSISIGRDNKADFSTHQKALNSYLYIPPSSEHPQFMMKGIIKGEIIRYARTCSHREDLLFMASKLLRRLHLRGWPIHVINPWINLAIAELPAWLSPAQPFAPKRERQAILPLPLLYNKWARIKAPKRFQTLNRALTQDGLKLQAMHTFSVGPSLLTTLMRVNKTAFMQEHAADRSATSS